MSCFYLQGCIAQDLLIGVYLDLSSSPLFLPPSCIDPCGNPTSIIARPEHAPPSLPYPPPPLRQNQELERGWVGNPARSDPSPRRRTRPQHAPRRHRRCQGGGATPGVPSSSGGRPLPVTAARIVAVRARAVLRSAPTSRGDVDGSYAERGVLASFGTGKSCGGDVRGGVRGGGCVRFGPARVVGIRTVAGRHWCRRQVDHHREAAPFGH